MRRVKTSAACCIPTRRAGVAVSAHKPVGCCPSASNPRLVLGSLAYHDYEGIAFRDDEKPRLQADLGNAKFLMLRNHGLLTVGATIADAFLAMYILETTCQIQIAAQAGGGPLTRR